MDVAALEAFSGAWAFASAFAVAILGASALAGGRARAWGALAFGLFAIVWGLQIVVANAAHFVSDAALAERLHLLAMALLFPLPYFLIEFALAQRAAPPGWTATAARGAAAGLALAGALVLLFAPDLLYRGVVERAGVLQPRRGPLYVVLVLLPVLGAFAAALALTAREARAAPTHRTADRLATVVAGLGVFLGFAAGNNLAFYATAVVTRGSVTDGTAMIALFGALTAVAAAVAILFARDAVAARDRRVRRRAAAVAAAVLVPLAAGAVEGALAVDLLVRLNTIGLWRCVAVGILAYGIARWRLFDLPDRATRAAAAGVGLTAAVAAGIAAWVAATALWGGGRLPLLAGLLVPVVVAAPSVATSRRLFGVAKRATPAAADAAPLGPRLEAYRAAVETSLGRGTLAEDRPFLESLRARFGLSPEVAATVEHFSSAAVLVPRPVGDAHGYERLRLLGEGSGGRTWLVRDRAYDRLAVLKEPVAAWHRAELRDRLRLEAQVALRVRHPHVVRVEAVLDTPRGPALLMEFVEGGSLADRFARDGPLTWPQARAILLDVLAGLSAVHDAGILHRDLKPANVLLDREGRAKVSDFGIAVARDAGGRTVVDVAGAPAGTPDYAPPEGFRADVLADVYAAGATLHACLTGAPPVAPFVAPPDLPPAAVAILARALAVEPGARYPSASAFRRALAEGLD